MFQSPRSRGRTRQDMYFTIPEQVSIPAVSREDATTLISPVSSLPCFNPLVLAGGRDITNWQRDNARGFQSTRPRGRTRQDFGYRNSAEISFNPRVLAGGRDIGISAVRDILIVSIPVPSQSRALAISQSRNLAISQSRNLAIMDCSLQAAGERKVKTMAKICQAETAIRGSLRVHDKRKPLNARRMPMHSFVSTPLQGTLDPME